MSTSVVGRPSKHSEALEDVICERIMEGLPLSKVCEMDDIPTRETVHTWLISKPGFSDKYVRACNVRREYRFETLLDVAEKTEDVQRARLKVDVIKWQLSKEEPKKYGDKIDHTTNGRDMPVPIIDLGSYRKDTDALPGDNSGQEDSPAQ